MSSPKTALFSDQLPSREATPPSFVNMLVSPKLSPPPSSFAPVKTGLAPTSNGTGHRSFVNGSPTLSTSPFSKESILSSGSTSADGHGTVVASCEVPAFTIVGTYTLDFQIGYNTEDEPNITRVVEVKYVNGKLITSDGSSNWLRHVQPARDRHEQNVEVFCDNETSGCKRVTVRTLRSVQKGEQLFVWYSDQLARSTGIPILTPDNIKGKQRYTCTKCQKSYLYPNTLKAHMRFRCPQSRAQILSSLGKIPSLPFSVFQSSPNRVSATTSSETASENGLLKTSTRTAFRRVNSPTSTSGEDIRHDERPSPFSGFLPPGMGSATACTSSSQSQSNLASEIALNLSTKASFPERNLSNSSTSDRLPQSTTQPIQIFNHIHPPAIPFAFEHSAFQCYCPFYTKFHDPTRYCCANLPSNNAGTTPRNSHENLYFQHPCPVPFPLVQVRNLPGSTVVSGASHNNVDENLRMRELPLKFPLPSEKAGEPLDLLPRSLYTSKSRKGHLCIYCGKLYSRKYGLKIHLRTHTGYKPLKCKVCLRPFGDPSNLNKHIRLHAEGDTPYRCEFCGKVLVRRRDLERHIKSRHPNEVERSDSQDTDEATDSLSGLKVEPEGSSTEEETTP
ncbi:zinc finger protein 236 [Octopus sinensis]|uniref:Zinc finger protein 236 n=1 Tax=Octopus sinensis TaxID=2607531 RepID=A0A6P7UBP4_9MOLL|nr:zinc finger protein 236 [Octopus sinensis]